MNSHLLKAALPTIFLQPNVYNTSIASGVYSDEFKKAEVCT